jgi:hypothetical protein
MTKQMSAREPMSIITDILLIRHIDKIINNMTHETQQNVAVNSMPVQNVLFIMSYLWCVR